MNRAVLGTILAISLLARPDGATGAVVSGRVADLVSGLPLAAAAVRVNLRQTSTDDSGRFVLRDLAPGSWLVEIRRIGYHAESRLIDLRAHDSLFVEFTMRRAPLEVGGLEVDSRPRGPDGTPVRVAGPALRRSLGTTLAATLDEQPGLAVRSMGPAPARPVLRGLSGNRLLVLSDGERTGDLSATASDHAVAIEPLMSHDVEVVRGPRALLHGSNTLGGVVDVHLDAIPRRLPEHAEFSLAALGESVHGGGSTGGDVLVPMGSVAARAGGLWRRTGDLSTSTGTLSNTGTDHREGSAGMGWFGEWGSVGAAAVDSRSGYGVPGGFLGGHEKGVDIRVERSALDVRAALRPGEKIEELALRGRSTRYFHEELESNGACGVSFGVLTYDASLDLGWRPAASLGPGAVRVWGEYRDYAQGCLSFSPPTIERSAAFVIAQEARAWGLSWQASARWELRTVTPSYRDSNKAGSIEPRSFAGWSGGLATTAFLNPAWSMTTTVMTTHHAPGVEELFSEGPHLAAYAYEIGNAALDAERALGIEIATRYQHGGRAATLAAFAHLFPNYIFVRNTGEIEVGPGESGLLARFQYSGQRARMWGGEASLRLPLAARVSLEASASAVFGTLLEDHEPMPLIPPLRARASLAKGWRDWTCSAVIRGAAAQRRLGSFEEPTEAWCAADLQVEYDLRRSARHVVVLTLENFTNTEYREHLSRVKSVQAEPGRNLKVLLRVTF